MAQIAILGTAAAVSDADHDYTHFLLTGDTSAVLVDCGSNPLGKIRKFGLQDDAVQDIILTHFHPDHVAGVPTMLMHLWLLGRQLPLRIYALDHCARRIDDMMLGFAWDSWPDFFPLTFNIVDERDGAPVLDNDDFRILAWPTKHFVPTIGLRIENKRTGHVLAYSCDTEPVPAIVALARDADILIHETAGSGPGHSSAAEAGKVASEAGAKALYLIHYQVWNSDPRLLVAEAQTTYAGPIVLCEDGDVFEF